MRYTKITALIALSAISAFFLALSFAPPLKGGSSKTASPAGPIAAEFIGINGMVFQPGERIDIQWVLKGEGVKYFETHPWGECELVFSADGGKTWARITPQIGVTNRRFEWTVPDTLTREGMVGLQIGIEGESDYYLFTSEPFSVLSPLDAARAHLQNAIDTGNFAESKLQYSGEIS